MWFCVWKLYVLTLYYVMKDKEICKIKRNMVDILIVKLFFNLLILFVGLKILSSVKNAPSEMFSYKSVVQRVTDKTYMQKHN